MLSALCLLAATEMVTSKGTEKNNCIGDGQYWNASADACLETCESGVYKTDEDNAAVKTCISEEDCTSDMFTDGTVRECVSSSSLHYEEEENRATYYLNSCPIAYPVDGIYGECDTCDTSSNGELLYWSKIEKKCVSECPDAFTPEGDSYACLNCADKYVDLTRFDAVTKRCTNICPKYEFLQLDRNTCDTGCDTKMFTVFLELDGEGYANRKWCVTLCLEWRVEENVTVNGVQETYVHCYVDKCPDGLYYINRDSNTTCVDEQGCIDNGLLPYEHMAIGGYTQDCVTRD